VAPLKKNEENPPLLFMTLINRFQGGCGTFGEGKKKPIIVNNVELISFF
jgi:hypothetical protein